MSIKNLVQIGDAEYCIPADVVRVYVGQPFKNHRTGEIEPATTYVVVRTANVMAGLFGYTADHSEQVMCSKWPIDRVRAVLGLADNTSMHSEFEKIADDEEADR